MCFIYDCLDDKQIHMRARPVKKNALLHLLYPTEESGHSGIEGIGTLAVNAHETRENSGEANSQSDAKYARKRRDPVDLGEGTSNLLQTFLRNKFFPMILHLSLLSDIKQNV